MKAIILARLAVLFTLTTAAAHAVDALPAGSNLFADAPAITTANGRSVTTNLTTFTSETDEPLHHPNGNSGGEKSAWWSWTAPESGFCTVSTRQGAVDANPVKDTLLGVYTGTAVNNLAVVGRNDDYSVDAIQADRFYSSVVFYAVAGTTYKIAADAYDSSDVTLTSFTVRLELRLVPIRKMVRSSSFARNDIGGAGVDLCSVTLTTTGTGRFSGKLTTLSKTYSFTGIFGVDGLATISFDRPAAKGAAPKTPITLVLDIAGEGQVLMLQDNTRAGEVFPERMVFAKSSPSEVAGQFTSAITYSTNPNAGFGTLSFSVSKTGQVKGAGAALDGTPFTFSSALHKTLVTTEFFVPALSVLHSKKGGLQLALTLADQGVKDVFEINGNYLRPPVPDAAFYEFGYQDSVTGAGSTYVAPAAGSRAMGFLDPAGAGKMQVFDGGSELPNGSFDEALTFSTANKFTFNSATRKPSLKLNPKTGLVTGFVSDPPAKKRAIRGVIYEVSDTVYLEGNVGGTGRTLYFRVTTP